MSALANPRMPQAERTQGPMACGHFMEVFTIRGFRIIPISSDYFIPDIPAFRARNVCLDCENAQLMFAGTDEAPGPPINKDAPMPLVEVDVSSSPSKAVAAAKKPESLGPMSCGHHADVVRQANGRRWLWFGPLEYCLDVPDTRARWVCQRCRDQVLGLIPPAAPVAPVAPRKGTRKSGKRILSLEDLKP